MSTTCARPLSWAQLVDYWAGDAPPDQQEAFDEHLMGCAACSAESTRVASITETMRGMLPPIITDELLPILRARGTRVLENPMQPGERKEVLFPNEVDVLIHRLGGLPLAEAASVRFVLLEDGTDRLLVELHDVPFERAKGCVLVACQKHFRGFPEDNVAEIRVRDASGSETVHRFTILHRFESP